MGTGRGRKAPSVLGDLLWLPLVGEPNGEPGRYVRCQLTGTVRDSNVCMEGSLGWSQGNERVFIREEVKHTPVSELGPHANIGQK